MAPRQSTLVWLALASQAIAAPAGFHVVDHVDNVDNINSVPEMMTGVGCSGLMKKAICCSGDILGGTLHTGCVAPFPNPGSPEEFKKFCTDASKQPLCCTANIVSVSLDPVPHITNHLTDIPC